MYCIKGRIIGRDFTGGNLASSRLKYNTKKGSKQISNVGSTPSALTSVTFSFYIFYVAKIKRYTKNMWRISAQFLFKNSPWKYLSTP